MGKRDGRCWESEQEASLWSDRELSWKSPPSHSECAGWESEGGFGGLDGWLDGDDAVDACHLEEFHNAVADAGDDQLDAFAGATDMVIDDGAHAGRVHVGDTGEVEDGDGRRIAGADHGLKFKEIAQGEWTLEVKDRCAGIFAGLLLNRKGFIESHAGKCKEWNGVCRYNSVNVL